MWLLSLQFQMSESRIRPKLLANYLKKTNPNNLLNPYSLIAIMFVWLAGSSDA